MNKKILIAIVIFVVAMAAIGGAFIVQASAGNSALASASSNAASVAASTDAAATTPSTASTTSVSEATKGTASASTATAPAGSSAAATSSTSNTGSNPQKASSSQTTATTKTNTQSSSKSGTSSGSATTGKSLAQIFKDKGIDPSNVSIVIKVDKSAHTLGIYVDGALMKSYHVELGDTGLGDKKVSGDHKTPEGTFYIAEKSVLDPPDEYLGTRWMRLSYPNIEDAQRGLDQGLIGRSTYNSIVSAINNGEIPPQNTALGGGVGIHGGSTAALGTDWTWGCVGLTNKDVEDFFHYVRVGTKVIIYP